MGPRRSQLALLLTVLAAVFRAGSTVTPCELCATPIEAPCTAPCLKGSAPVPVLGSTCTKFTCKTGEHFRIEPTLDPEEFYDEIICDANKKWITEAGDPVSKASCVMKEACVPTNKPDSKCDGVEGAAQCEVLGAFPATSCPIGKKMFLKLKDNPWKEIAKVVCDSNDLMAKNLLADPEIADDPIEGAGDNVVCAKHSPDSHFCPGRQDPIKIVPQSLCDSNIADFVQCEQILKFPYPKCTTGTKKMFMKVKADTVWKEIDGVTCDINGVLETKSTGATPTPIGSEDNVVCAEHPPDSKKCPSNLKAVCDGLNGGCQQAILHDVDPITCSSLPPALSIYLKTVNKDWEAIPAGDKISCDIKSGRWVREDTIANSKVDLLQNDEVVCSATQPKFSCMVKNLLEVQLVVDPAVTDPEVVTLSDDILLACPTPASKILYYKKAATGSSWEKAGNVQCDQTTGKWKQGDSGGELEAGDSVLCADPVCDVKPTSVCPTSPAPPPLFVKCAGTPVVSPVSCAGLDTYYTTADPNAGPWVKADDGGVKCHTDGQWKATTQGSPTPLTATSSVVCAKHNPKSVACTTKSPNNQCKGLAGDCKEVALIDESALACTSGDLYLKKVVAGGPWLKVADTIKCNIATGDLEQGPLAGPSTYTLDVQVPTQEDHVVCATGDPTPTPCTSKNTLSSSCPDPTGCVALAPLDDNAPLTCTGSATGKKLFVQRINTLHWEAPKGDNIKCNLETGEWQEGTSSAGLQKLEGSVVVCADSAPPGPCPNLDLACPLGSDADPILCTTATPYNNPVCATGNNIYFMKGTTKFQEATSITCNGGEWELKYNRGVVEETEKLVDGDHLICAKSNPDPIVCQYITGTSTKGIGAKYVSDNWAVPKLGVEAGKTAECPQVYDEFYTQTGLSRSLNAPPICDTSSKWMMYEDGKFVDFGPTVGCKTAKCKKCPQNPPAISSPFTSDRGSPLKFDAQGSCAELRCDRAEPKFVIKELNEEMIRYYTGSVTCTDEEIWHFGSESKEVGEIECVQQLYCADPVANVLKAKFECPAGIPTDQGCVNPSVIDHSNVECTAPKKMFVKGDSEVWWYEIATTKITCDVKRGEWQMTLLGQTAADKEFRGPENTFICADQNPNPEPPPIATTTPAPREICELCKDYLPPACDKCSNSSLIFERECEKCPDVCIMKSSNEKEYKLLINGNLIPPGNILNCTRPVANDEGTPDPKWRTTDGVDVAEVSARPEMAAKKWGGGQYGILAGALFFIGAMGLGCVLIYFRMRKKPSLREKKKKERGVTKKYTSANVIKTGGRSERGSKEGGKSMEPTKSKAEDNNSNLDEAPTLKL